MDLAEPALTADRCLVEVAERLDYLMAVTPLDTEGAWRAFEASGYRSLPELRYRPVPFDPAAERARLGALLLDAVRPAALARILERLRAELDGLCRLVEARATPEFLTISTEVHGAVDDAELALATAVLDVVAGWDDGWRDAAVDAAEFAAAAGAELDRLREAHPGLEAGIELRDDVHGVMVLRGTLLIDVHLRMDPRRVEALVQHEVGTHVVTEANGARQPLRCLGTGLGGYESTQEGIAVLAEHAVGGLTAERLALLAARVLVARRCTDGTAFADSVAELVDTHGFSHRSAFDIVLRVHRGGGLLKDAGYLRGLGGALAHLGSGGALDLLLIGKVAFEDLDDIGELIDDGVLTAPVVRPGWSEHVDAAALPEDVVALAGSVAHPRAQ
jgi:uncharacterized protein (TIGR02421 family)